MNSSNKYKVSVRLMTYNHEPFIREAMNGIMMQKTDFKVEVIVGDDFSTDNTLSIIRSYKSTEQIHINVLDRKPGDEYWKKRQELGRLYNFANILENCSGEYIALLDGDDYWTDPYKLQKQVGTLDSKKEFVVSFTDSAVVDAKNKVVRNSKLPIKFKKNLSNKQLVGGTLMPTNTVMFKNNILGKFPAEFFRVTNGDTFLFSMLGHFGCAYFEKDVSPAAYRVHSNGVWSKKNKKNRIDDSINTFQQLLRVVDKKYERLIKQILFVKCLNSCVYEEDLMLRLRRYRKAYAYFYIRPYMFRLFFTVNLSLIKKIIFKNSSVD